LEEDEESSVEDDNANEDEESRNEDCEVRGIRVGSKPTDASNVDEIENESECDSWNE
jgi:hypothetical protein